MDSRKQNSMREPLARLGLYHSFLLPDGRELRGVLPRELLQHRIDSYQFPANLTGKRALDIGPWDGYFTFELERRGADVVAIDYVDLDTFRELHRLYQSRAAYHQLDVYELDPARHGKFDIVLCLGVLYHLKHPLLALEKICAVTTDVCIVDSFVLDGGAVQAGIPYAEFYEHDQLGGQLDNWCGPTVSALAAWIRAAGFARAELLHVAGDTARLAAHRHWLPASAGAPPTILHGLNGHRHRGRTFHSQQEEYLVLWCLWEGDPPKLDQVFPEVDGYGVAPLSCVAVEAGVTVSVRLPPGLAPGRHHVAIRLGDHGLSQSREFYLDLPPLTSPVELLSVQDGITWADAGVDYAHGGWLTAWVKGLSPEAEVANVAVLVGEVPHRPEAVNWNAEAQAWQVNTRLRPVILPGRQAVAVLHREQRSNALPVEVTGERPVFIASQLTPAP